MVAVVLWPQCHPADWYGATEAAVAALYALHPSPPDLCAAIVNALAERALGVQSAVPHRYISAHPSIAIGTVNIDINFTSAWVHERPYQ